MTQVGEDGDLVLPAVPLGNRVLLPGALSRQPEEFAQAETVSLGPPRVAQGLALHDQQAVEVQERIGQQGFPLQGHDFRGVFLGRRIALFEPLAQVRQACLAGIQPAEVLLGLGVPRAEGLAKVLDRQTQGRAIHLIERCGLNRSRAAE